MAHADMDFYQNEYKGVPVEDTTLIDRLLHRASRDIDILIGFANVEELPSKSQHLVKLAVCAQAEFLVIKGETASTVANEHGSVSIGSYSEASSGQFGAKSQTPPARYSQTVREYLLPTGLLYGGVAMHGN